MKKDSVLSFKRIYAEKYVKECSIKTGHVNGIVLSGGIFPHNNDVDTELNKITIDIVSSKGRKTIMKSMPLTVLRDISNYYFGSTAFGAASANVFMYRAIQEIRDALRTLGLPDGTLTSITGTYNVMDNGGIVIPLGGIYCDYDRTVEITLELSSNNDQLGFGVVDITSYSNDLGVDHLLEYDITKDIETKFSLVQSAWLMNSNYSPLQIHDDGAEDYVGETDIELSFENESNTRFSASECLRLANTFGRVESTQLTHSMPVFEKDGGIPLSGEIELTGYADNYKLLFIREVYDLTEIARNTINQLSVVRQATEKIEREMPDQAKAMRYANILSKSEDLRVIEDAVQQ